MLLLLKLAFLPFDEFALNWGKHLTCAGPICLDVTLDQIAKVKFGSKALFGCSEHHSCFYLVDFMWKHLKS